MPPFGRVSAARLVVEVLLVIARDADHRLDVGEELVRLGVLEASAWVAGSSGEWQAGAGREGRGLRGDCVMAVGAPLKTLVDCLNLLQPLANSLSAICSEYSDLNAFTIDCHVLVIC